MRWTLALLVVAGPAFADPALTRITLSQGGVGQSAPALERIELSDAEPDALAGYAANGQLDQALRASLQRLMAQRAELDRKQATLTTLQDRRTRIVTDQDRIRANLAAVPPQSELQRRYLAQMLARENDLAALQKQTDAAQSAVDQADAALKDAILNLKA